MSDTKPSEREAPFLFLAMDDDNRASMTYCVNRDAVRQAVKAAMFWCPDDELDRDHLGQLDGTVETLMDAGVMNFEGDPPLYLFRLASPPAGEQAQPEPEGFWHWLMELAECGHISGMGVADEALIRVRQALQLHAADCGDVYGPDDVRAAAAAAAFAEARCARMREAREDDLYWRLHSLSTALESSGRIDAHEHPDAYATILDAMGAMGALAADKERS